MLIKGVRTAKSSRTKCVICKQAIIKGEGVLVVSGVYKPKHYYLGTGFICYKCSLLEIERGKRNWDARHDGLILANKRSEEELKDFKMVKEI